MQISMDGCRDDVFGDRRGLRQGTRRGVERGRGSVASAVLASAIMAMFGATFATTQSAHADGTVRCWGYNSSVPSDLGSVRSLGRGNARDYTAFVICSGDYVRDWGGIPPSNDSLCGFPATPPNLGPILSIAMAESNAAFRQLDLRLQYSDGCGTWIAVTDVADIALSYNCAIAARTNGSVTASICSTGDSVPAAAIPSRHVAAGGCFAMSLRLDGTVVCWGENQYGECDVPEDLGVVQRIAAGREHALAIRADGSLRCWGSNGSGQCAIPSDLGSVVDVAGGWWHTVALQIDGSVRCWGNNDFGQCNVPNDLGSVTSISAGAWHTLALSCGPDVATYRSPDLGAFGFNQGKQHTFSALPPTSAAPVQINVWARGDLDLASEFLTIKADDQIVGAVFNTVENPGGWFGTGSQLYHARLMLSESQYASIAADGAITLRAEPSLGVNATEQQNGALMLQLDVTLPGVDCNENGRNDTCDIDLNPLLDCDQNGMIDSCEGAGGGGDCNANGVSDECEIAANPVLDCDQNGAIDACEISIDPSLDCNNNNRIDTCDVSGEFGAFDCDNDDLIDSCEIESDPSLDCDFNGQLDACEVAGRGGAADCDNDNLIDTCEIAANPSLDCNNNGRLDSCDIGQFGEQDKDGDGRPDSCEFARGDFDLDGQVGAADLSGLLAIWGLQNPPYGDFNDDGIVGGADMSFILANWGPVEY